MMKSIFILFTYFSILKPSFANNVNVSMKSCLNVLQKTKLVSSHEFLGEKRFYVFFIEYKIYLQIK